MQTTSPESVGMSSERLARIDEVMHDFVRDDRLPGIMTLVQRRGEVVQFGTYGHMDIAKQRPIAEDTIFRIYSMTKPIASVALMMLVEAGKLTLSDPVEMYIPAFGETKVWQGSMAFGTQLTNQNPMMTVRHLLTHTSGLGYGLFEDHPVEELYRQMSEQFRKRDVSLETYIHEIAKIPLRTQPGTEWYYSIATTVIGYLVQVIADMPFDDFLQEHIFSPLGMEDTAFEVAPEKVGRLAEIYTSEALYNPIAIAPDDVGGLGDITKPTIQPLGGAGLISTLHDYRRFANCLLNGGELDGARILSSRTLNWMTSDHLDAHMLPITLGGGRVGSRFGLGFRVVRELGEAQSNTSIGEFGWSGAAQTFFSVAPAEDMVLLFMSQLLPNAIYPVRNRFTNMVYAAIME